MKVIETVNLTKYYGKNKGIENLCLSVEQGDFFGFIGPNGAGKSTTIRTLLGMIAKTSGSASVLGLDIKSKHTEILSRVGYMPGEASFYPGMRVCEVISLSAKLRGLDCSREALYLCERLQLDTGKRVEELSLGNRKKAAVVCALQHKPELYILDEPTSGLDPLMQKEFFEILSERNKEGATVFLSSHILSEIQRHCLNAAIIRDGSIIACDAVEALSKTAARRVVLHGVSGLPELPGIADFTVGGNSLSFLYSGEMPALISALNGLPITDMTVSEPDLEEVFMHFYETEAAQ